jgi:outer membrane protein
MMKKMLLAAVSFGVLNFGWSAVKVGTVDLEKALQGVKKGKDAKSRLEKKFKDKKVKFDKQKSDFEKNQEEFKKKSVVLSEKAKSEQLLVLQQKFAELQQINQQAQMEMQSEELKETQPILKGLADMMTEVGKEAGVEMVFEAKAGLLYATDRVDLTDKLIEKFDKKK